MIVQRKTLKEGVWLVRHNGEILKLIEDPGTEFYIEPTLLAEKEPTGKTPFVNSSDAYTRFVLRDGPQSVGAYYAAGELSGTKLVALLDRMYGLAGAD